ncbi:YggS family pyridoxal phosphate-dependent enzyme [Virgibacillus sp. YIM 98842]|uniref:YggS family pyridoxal phosphate-dependent enzyme n=1 Tax=Virgibacillus sp. YIM 98842 TaxID=2663533 RepID=UPI001969CE3C|nr:YggS family pyridoxal phosphate-dependent enzyme [Virgibacillus sp. YIM 98842]
MDVAVNLDSIQKQIRQACARSNRNLEEITIIGVTKYVTIERTEEALQAGVTNFGENRLDGFLTKYNHFQDRAKWHFIGTLQSRKVKEVIDKVDMIHSLDRMSLAKEINKRASDVMDCFVQVNVSGEETKHGLKTEEVLAFMEEVSKYEKVRVVGLMTMAPQIEDESRLREIFRSLARLRDEVRNQNFSHAPCEFLSMGMSNDFSIAVEEGATHIRIGSSLVGE